MLSTDPWLAAQLRLSEQYWEALRARAGDSVDALRGPRRTPQHATDTALLAQHEYHRFIAFQREEQIKALARQAGPGGTRYRALEPTEVQDRIRRAGELALGLHAKYRQVPGLSLQWMTPMDEWDVADEAEAIRETGEAPFKTHAVKTDTGGFVFPGDPFAVWLRPVSDEQRLQALVAHEVEHCRYYARTPREAWDREESERLAEDYQREALTWFDHVGAENWRRIAREYAQG